MNITGIKFVHLETLCIELPGQTRATTSFINSNMYIINRHKFAPLLVKDARLYIEAKSLCRAANPRF